MKTSFISYFINGLSDLEEKMRNFNQVMMSIFIGLMLTTLVLLVTNIKLDWKILMLLFTGFSVAVFFGISYFFKRIEKSNSKSESTKELVATITERTGELVKKGTATISIDGCNYFIQAPFQKEGPTPLNNTQGSVFQYLSSLHLIQPVEKKLIGWLRDDIKIEDVPVSEYGLCYFLRDFHAENHNSTVHLATIHNGPMLMIMAIEQNGPETKERGLGHMACLINAVSSIEDKHFDGYALLSPFRLMENPEMVSKHLRMGNKSIYCFLVKY